MFKFMLFEGQPYIQRLKQYEEHYVVPVNTNSTDTEYRVNWNITEMLFHER